MSLQIKGFIETSFLDWDGKVVSTVFLPHCNFRCPICHNFRLIETPQNYESISPERVIKFIVDRKAFIDGVCLTGGEPCLHKNCGLFEFMQRVKDLGFEIKLDTNGEDPECLKEAIDQKLVDYIAMDIKAPLDERYQKISGIKTDLDKIKQSIKIIMGGNIAYEFRTTVVPTLLYIEEIREIARFIKGAKKFVLQQFVAENCWDESLRSVKPYSREKLEEMVEASKDFVANTLLRGV